jgi:homoserine kinase
MANIGSFNSDTENGYGWRAVVPATSANLGCAFDCGGLALKLYLKALFIPSSNTEDLTIEYVGATPKGFPLDPSNLVLHALCYAAGQLGAPPPCGHVQVESDIPISVGLGSSAAAVIAGLLLGARYAGADVNAEQLLRWAEKLEGHIDNAAAAYHGGLVFAMGNGTERVVTMRADFPESIRLIAVSPSIAVPTHKARQVLPAFYGRGDVVHSLQRVALLASTCFSGNFDLFPELFDDKLHQPYRQELVPGIERCLRLRREGLLGVAISGSGSSVIAFATRHEAEIARALQEIFAEEGVQAEARSTSADNSGAWVTREPVLVTKRPGTSQHSGRTE